MDVDAIEHAGRERFGELIDRDALADFIADREADAAHAAEIYLGAACARRSPAALAALDTTYIARVPDILAAKRLPPHAVDEIQQTVRHRLLAGDPPYLATAVGRGSLAGLIAVIANRCAVDWLRANNRADHQRVSDTLAATADPARDLDRARGQTALKSAFEAAVEELDTRDRTLLRLHLVDGLTIDDIARMYKIHRATAARQIERAREQVAATTRRRLSLVDGFTRDEMGELVTMVASQLDLSLSRVLRT